MTTPTPGGQPWPQPQPFGPNPTDRPAAEPVAAPAPTGPVMPGRGARHTRRPSWWRPWTSLAIGLVLAFGVGIGASVISLPYAIMQPGPATNVLGTTKGPDGKESPRIVISQAPTYPTTGALDFTTVRVLGGPGYPVNAFDLLGAWLDPDAEVLPVDAVFPPTVTEEQVAEENKAEMVGSQQEAAAVAVRATGHDVPLVVTISKLSPGSPSEGQLQAGDVLVSVAGAPASDPTAVRAAIQKATPGDTLDVVVTRGGANVTAHPKTGKADDGRTILGIMLSSSYSLPFPVTIDAGNVGGPSAGLMFSLGVYDKLTDGAMTGGQQIAGTGTIDDTGRVGPIGGIRQKIAGAKAAGARFFLAPSDNCAEVTSAPIDGIQVVKVTSFADARDAVTAIGQGNITTLPHC